MGAIEETSCLRYSAGTWSREPAVLVREAPVTIFVNGRELATVLCTPVKINFLAFGLLFSEGIIESAKDVASMRVCDDESEVDVRLTRTEAELSEKRLLTSGCGGGFTGAEQDMEKLTVKLDFSTAPEIIVSLMKKLLESAGMHREYGGLHTSALADAQGLLLVAEDIGRHNTLDKIAGECLLEGISTCGRVLLSTGRVSSEMLLKAGRMGVPVVVSRGAVTGRAVSFADRLNIAAVGYARGERFTVYSHPERIKTGEASLAHSLGR